MALDNESERDSVFKGAQTVASGMDVSADNLFMRAPTGAVLRWDGYGTDRAVGVDRFLMTPGLDCGHRPMCDFIGRSITDGGGTSVVSIRKSACFDRWKISSVGGVYVLLTAESSEPANLAYTTEWIGDPLQEPLDADLEITIRSWSIDGSPRGETPFSWRAVLYAHADSAEPGGSDAGFPGQVQNLRF